MKKELKDYLHFYLGCEVVYKNVRLILWKTDRVNCDLLDDRINAKYHTSINNIKPILRPWRDITDNEAIELIRVNHPKETHTIITGINLRGTEIHFQAKTEKMRYFTIFCIGMGGYKPNEFKWLLENKFDLFGLIEAGLAIDATTIKAEI